MRRRCTETRLSGTARGSPRRIYSRLREVTGPKALSPSDVAREQCGYVCFVQDSEAVCTRGTLCSQAYDTRNYSCHQRVAPTRDGL
ncbi:hypothetical protein OH76DRAFT_1559401 [Lentinus brumalis]|uniref:Uncharacterized protein n=1 Tax=Lentinus brumalis TaxID=2498619 RepID=A0A371CXG1_9APHY|nr:hypothetical protein OH76DRAFT_1559401 [Polyporus brumalis]